ncbi:MAG: type IV pilus secretin PilQ [Georgfuchsia sp.]
MIQKQRWIGLCAAFIFALGVVTATCEAVADDEGVAVTTNAIEKIEASAISGQTLLKVTLRQPLANLPSSFTVSSPPRIAFDFINTTNESGSNTKQVSLSDLQSINIVQAGARTRLVLNLNRSSRYDAKLDGSVLYISLGGVVASVAATSSTGISPTFGAVTGRSSDEGNSIQNVDFRVESSDVARINIDLSDPNPLIDVKRQGSSLVLLLQGVKLPDRLARRLDVRDFGTPVVSATTTALGQGTQMVIAGRGDWDYNVTQLDTTVKIEVRRVVNDPNSLANAKEIQGKTVSFNFTQPVPVSQMIGIFQDITGLNFVIMPGVTGEIERLKMENTPVETAIDVISRMYGLSMRRYSNLVVVGRAADLAKYEKEAHDLTVARQDTAPIEQESIKVRYRPAAEIVAALTGSPLASNPSSSAYGTGSTVPSQGSGNQQQQSVPSGGQTSGNSLISARGSIASDAVTNTIFVDETRAQLNKIRERVAALDLPIKQVMIEARIVSVTTDFSRSLGSKLSFIANPSNATMTGTLASSPNSPAGITSTYGAGKQAILNGGFNSAAGASSGNIVLSLLNANQTRLLQLELSASETDGNSKSISSPKILTQDGRQATITDGQTLFYQLQGGTNGPTTVSVDAATKLDVTPQIGSDGKIQLKLNVNKGGVGTVTTNAGPSVTKQEVKTNVVVENGGTLMLGGVFTDQESDATSQVPLLGDIPFLGWMFKQKTKNRNRTELLIFLTPRIVTEELTLQ